jgi:hypothetical protein
VFPVIARLRSAVDITQAQARTIASQLRISGD